MVRDGCRADCARPLVASYRYRFTKSRRLRTHANGTHLAKSLTSAAGRHDAAAERLLVAEATSSFEACAPAGHVRTGRVGDRVPGRVGLHGDERRRVARLAAAVDDRHRGHARILGHFARGSDSARARQLAGAARLGRRGRAVAGHDAHRRSTRRSWKPIRGSASKPRSASSTPSS